MVQAGVVNPFGPHQRLKCAGSVHARKACSRGASKTRLMTTSCSVAAVPLALGSCADMLNLLLRGGAGRLVGKHGDAGAERFLVGELEDRLVTALGKKTL